MVKLVAGLKPVSAPHVLPNPAIMHQEYEAAVAELFGSRAGLGRLISQSADAFNMPELFAGVVVLAVAGIAMTASFGWIERKLVPWTRD